MRVKMEQERGCNPLQIQCDLENKVKGSLKGMDCPECLNKGYSLKVVKGEMVTVNCSCMKQRASIKRIAESGLEGAIDKLTFDSYIAKEEWQKSTKSCAEKYSQEGNGAWFFIGGQSGSGKTHLCTAIAGKLLRDGKSLKYMRWRDEATRLKSLVNDSAYSTLIDECKTVDVLYIDDFLKTQRGQQPTSADVNLAFEILNYRYSSQKATIISSERSSNEIIYIDEALGSRIVELSKEYCVNIKNDRSRNYRITQTI